MPTRPCMVWLDTLNTRCLGHPEVDDERYPPLCPKHLDLFRPLIEAKARLLADQMFWERMAGRPRWNRQDRTRQPATAMLRRGEHISDADKPILDFLRGAA